MPLVKVEMLEGGNREYKQAILDGLHSEIEKVIDDFGVQITIYDTIDFTAARKP